MGNYNFGVVVLYGVVVSILVSFVDLSSSGMSVVFLRRRVVWLLHHCFEGLLILK